MGSNAGQMLEAALPAIAGSIILPGVGTALGTAMGGVAGGTGLASALAGGALSSSLGGAIGGGLGGALSGGGVEGTALGALGGYGTGSLTGGLGTMGSALADGSSLGNAFTAGFPTISGLGSSISNGVSNGISGLESGVSNLFSPTATTGSNIVWDTPDPSASLSNSIFNSPQAIQSGLATGGIDATNPADQAVANIAAQSAGGASSSFNNFMNTGSTLAGATPATGAGTAAAAGGGTSAFSGLGPILSGVSGLMNANTISKAEGQLQAGQQANQAALAPYLATGNAANAQYQNLLTNPNIALQNNPGYQFQLQQGNNALDNQLSYTGLNGSGAALKAAEQFGQGLAGQTYQSALANALSGAQNIGLNAVGGGITSNNAMSNIGATATGYQNANILSALAGLFGGQKSSAL